MDQFPSRERSAAAALEPRVTAIIVIQRPDRAFELCLRSAFAESWIDDVVIVDHGNPAEISSSLRALQADRRDVRVVAANAALSRAAAANLGAARARGRWLLFLDPHVVQRRGAVAAMAAAGGEARAPWIVGGALTDADGRERRAARAGALTTWSALAIAMDWGHQRRSFKSRRAKRDPLAPERVAAVSGAFMLAPKADFESLGGFDEAFATHGADLDLCRRAREAGGNVLFQSNAAGVQFEGRHERGWREAQGLARFARKSARTPFERAFALVAGPALATLLALKDFVGGRPPIRR